MTEDDLYEILQCNENSSTDEIRSQYRKLALQTHPDKERNKSADGASRRAFDRVHAAWLVLSDAVKRAQYDANVKQRKCELFLTAPNRLTGMWRAVFATARTDSVLVGSDINASEMTHDAVTDVCSFPCRCGDKYQLPGPELRRSDADVIVECASCSLSIRICVSSTVLWLRFT
jgi:hypothetical protein